MPNKGARLPCSNAHEMPGRSEIPAELPVVWNALERVSICLFAFFATEIVGYCVSAQNGPINGNKMAQLAYRSLLNLR